MKEKGDNMNMDFSEDYEKWPDVGFKARPHSRKRGPSMVVELNVGGKREAFVSEGPPQRLHGAIEGGRCKFNSAAQRVSPEELHELIP
eukprot:6634333-Pyramimonas_sp.AAC.1